MKKIFNKKILIYFLAFIIPILIIWGYIGIREIMSGGTFFKRGQSFLIIDMQDQYSLLYGYFHNVLAGKDSIFYSFHNSLGSNMASTVGYYLSSPFNLLYGLVKRTDIPIVIAIIYSLKIALCSLFMNIYISHKFGNRYSNLLFSLTYAFMGFTTVYYFNSMWLDVIYMTPLVILGIDKLIDGKPLMYIITLCLSIIFNFYIAYMLSIFCVIYFIYELFIRYSIKDFKNYKKIILRFIISSLLAGGLSAFFLIPVICGLKEMLRYPINDYQISFAFNSKLKYFLNYVMPKIYIGSYNSNSILGRCGPIIYFGLFNLLLSYLYFFNKNIKRKEKILSLIIIIFFIMSFIIPGLQLFWQGFSFPNGFMDRYSFLLTFFLILLSVKQFYNYKNTKIMHIIIFLFMFLFLTIYVFEQNITLPYLNKQGILFTVIIMVLYLILYLYLFEYSKKKFFLIFLFFLTIIEIIISFNSLFIYQRYDISDYYKQSCKMFNTDNNTFYRIETVDYYNSFLDSFMCDFYSSKSTVSTNNAILHDFLLRNGGSLSYSHYMYDASVTPVLPSLLNVKYIYSINKLDTSYYNEIGYFYANNFVTEYKQKKINVYKNRFTLSVGFVIDDNYDKNYIKYNGTPFDNLNNLFYALSGENIQIFIPIDKEKIDELNYKYYIDRKTKYLFFSNNYEETIKVSSYTPVFVNDENIFVLNSLNIGMRKIKNDYYDENIVLSLDDNYLIKKFDLYYFDDKAFSKIIKKFKKNQLKKLKISGNRVSGNIDLNKNSTLFLSIPYNRGWQIYVDGKKVSYKKIADAFIGIEVPKGEHKISMKFYPKGIKLGIFISFVSIAVIIIFQRKGVYCA